MYFRSQKKTSQDVSLSDCIETGSDGTALSLMDVVSGDENVAEQVSRKELVGQVIQAVDLVLNEQERQVIVLRYGLGGQNPCGSGRWPKLRESAAAMYPGLRRKLWRNRKNLWIHREKPTQLESPPVPAHKLTLDIFLI